MLKEEQEQRINRIDDLISKNNSVTKGNDRGINIDELLQERKERSDFLVNVYEKIQEANLGKLKGDKFSNAHYIKRKSELEREKIFYSNLNTRHGRQVSGHGNVIEYDAYIKLRDVNERIDAINKEIEIIKNKLTLFNTKTTIEMEVTPYMASYISSTEAR